MNTTLAKRMIARADADGLPQYHEIRVSAQAFEDAAQGYFSKPQTVSIEKFFGQYARTKKLWSAYTGEPLI